MIVRVWRTASTPERASRYVERLERCVFPELGNIEGHRRAYLLQRTTDERVSFLVVTLWIRWTPSARSPAMTRR